MTQTSDDTSLFAEIVHGGDEFVLSPGKSMGGEGDHQGIVCGGYVATISPTCSGVSLVVCERLRN